MSAQAEQPARVFDVDAQTFQTAVVDASHQTPILVDFWADWCGPCKALAPVLEKIVSSGDGTVRLAKLDIDANQQLAGANGIRSIPTVRLFVDGKAIAQFMGAQPEVAIREFLTQHLPGAPAPDAPDPHQLIEDQLRDGQFEQATQTLEALPAAERNSPAGQSLAARLVLATQAAELPALAELESQVNKDPRDLGARLALSTREAAKGDYDKAMEGLLLIISRDRNFSDGAARKNILTIFDAMGPGDERVLRFRGALANTLN